MLINLLNARLFFIISAAFFLCQCRTETITSAPEVPSATKINKKLVNPYKLPGRHYLSLAKKQEGSVKQQSLLRAAARMVNDGQWRQGAAILAQISALTPTIADEKNLLLAQIDLMHERPQQAIQRLTQLNQLADLPLYQQIQSYELLAQAYQRTKKPMESMIQRIKLESLLQDERGQDTNRRQLWLSLTHLSQAELIQFTEETVNQPEIQGWLRLAAISRTYRDDTASLLAALSKWSQQFGSHPGIHVLPKSLDAVADKMLVHPRQVALLLPLSGPLQGPGSAIRDGFISAYKDHGAASSIQIKEYDTNKDDVVALYQKALDDGANYIVGPLTKPQVAAVAALAHPVPTLFLNDPGVDTQENAYSFGLSPSKEAVQAALKARSKGYNRALIIAPANNWGSEVTKAFSQQWKKSGARIVDTLHYGLKDDLNKKIRDFLHVTSSQKREKQLKQLLGYTIQPVANRRQDFDMVFLLAYPSKARQIMPLLRYYYAGNIPVYATASVYSGSANALKDKDLDGLIFCDIPWVFSHQMGARNWPEQLNSYSRLYALGKDSYVLATQLNQLMLFPLDKSQSGDGVLYLESSRQVVRVLEWGQFHQGLVHSLGEAA